MDVITV